MNLRPILKIVNVAASLAVLLFCAAPAHAQGDAAGLFKTKCAACHAPDGSGNTPTGKNLASPDLRSDEVQKKSDAQLIESTTNGKGKKMPAYKGKLTDDQIKQLVGYIRELGKKK
ncbi:MAG: c-type cytochrome [Candidatus Acidiferrales bacterium]